MRIEHVAMYVRDIERQRLFFEKYFMCTSSNLYHNYNTGFKSYFLSFEGGARLEIMSRPEIKDSAQISFTVGFSHIAFSVGSKEKVNKITDKLIKDGYKLISQPRTTGDGYYESCIQDEEGNWIEITV